jgi:hypothetical protein
MIKPRESWYALAPISHPVSLMRNSIGLAFQNKTGEMFAVVLGFGVDRVWCDVVTNFGNESLEKIVLSYDKSGGRDRKYADWIIKPLMVGKSVSVAIRKGVVSDETQNLAEIIINAKDSSRQGQETPLPPQLPRYKFGVRMPIFE